MNPNKYKLTKKGLIEVISGRDSDQPSKNVFVRRGEAYIQGDIQLIIEILDGEKKVQVTVNFLDEDKDVLMYYTFIDNISEISSITINDICFGYRKMLLEFT